MPCHSLAKVDSYKLSHYKQYAPGTEYISSYIEARGVDAGHSWKKVVFAGLQYYLFDFFNRPFVQDQYTLDAMAETAKLHGVSFNKEGFEYVLNEHGGYLPLHIQALPEGSVVPLGTPLVQVTNTDPKCAWATSYIETNLMRLWYPTTVATLSFHIKRTIRDFMMQTAGHTDGIDFKLHDFGARGVSSSESAMIGGAAHLMNFKGSDTLEAIAMVSGYYGSKDIAGYSIDAAEHSTITSFGGPENEILAFTHMLDTFGTEGKIFAVVSDTYNIWEACDNKWGGILKQRVEALGKIGAKLVVRPDSGDPIDTPVEVIERLMAKFGHTINSKGYKVLPPYIGVIQGDGINEQSVRSILSLMKMKGLSAENINFGMGGGLLQQVNRDTLKFAMKASAAKNVHINNGEWFGIQKNPITDQGKKSKSGRLAVVEGNSGIITVNEADLVTDVRPNLLETVYLNGEITRTTDFDTIRNRIAEKL